jgi:hypothetical protein
MGCVVTVSRAGVEQEVFWQPVVNNKSNVIKARNENNSRESLRRRSGFEGLNVGIEHSRAPHITYRTIQCCTQCNNNNIQYCTSTTSRVTYP